MRKQWAYFCKDRCSNGGHYFVKFKQRPMSWNHKQLIFEALMMLDMSHYNARFMCGMEFISLCFCISIGVLVAITYAVLYLLSY